MKLRVGSVCSGIESAAVAWRDLDLRHVWVSEIEEFPCEVLAQPFPDVPNLGDMTKIYDKEVFVGTAIDVLVGGTPCQSFSVAGLRKGMADPRGNLALEFLKILDTKRPEWMVWENVPGVFSSLSHIAPDPRRPDVPVGSGSGEDGGVDVEDNYDSEELHALNCFLAGLSELGYGWSYRVLDAQYIGVPQRRRRIFVVGHLGDWAPATAVLFEPHSLSGDNPPSRAKGKDVAPTISSRPTGGGGLGTDFEVGGGLIPSGVGGADADRGRGRSGVLGEPVGFIPEISKAVSAGPQGHRHDPSENTYIAEPVQVETFRMKGFGDYTASASALKQRDAKDATDLVVGTLMAGQKSAGSATQQDAESGLLIPVQPVLLTMREGKEGGEKGPLLQDDRSASLATGNGQVLFQPVPLDLRNAGRDPEKHDQKNRQGIGVGNPGDQSHTITSAFVPGVVSFEPGIMSREGGHVYDNISGTIRSEPGDNQMTVMVPKVHDMRGNGDGEVVPTITGDHAGRPTDYTPVVSFQPANFTRGMGQPSEDTAATLRAETKGGDQQQCVAIPLNMQVAIKKTEGKNPHGVGIGNDGEPSNTLGANDKHAVGFQAAGAAMQVRRLTPRECERLQGFPDDWTLIKWGKPMDADKVPADVRDYLERSGYSGETLLQAAACPDGPRYKALGNSMAVPVMRWIGKRLLKVHQEIHQ